MEIKKLLIDRVKGCPYNQKWEAKRGEEKWRW